jgi:hypothetical protein
LAILGVCASSGWNNAGAEELLVNVCPIRPRERRPCSWPTRVLNLDPSFKLVSWSIADPSSMFSLSPMLSLSALIVCVLNASISRMLPNNCLMYLDAMIPVPSTASFVSGSKNTCHTDSRQSDPKSYSRLIIAGSRHDTDAPRPQPSTHPETSPRSPGPP